MEEGRKEKWRKGGRRKPTRNGLSPVATTDKKYGAAINNDDRIGCRTVPFVSASLAVLVLTHS